VVGAYADPSTGNFYGFLYQSSVSVPEPSGVVLLAIGLATTAGYLVRQQRRRATTVQAVRSGKRF
jgi:hypothetical protein